MKAAVVVEDGADVEAVTGLKVPRLVSVGIVVDDNFAPKGEKWCDVVAMGANEVLLGRDGRIRCVLA